MKRILTVLLLLAPLTVTGVNLSTFNWDAPTTYNDGSAMPGSDIASYTVYCGTSAGVYTVTQNVGNVISTPIIPIISADGGYYCALTTTDIKGVESAKTSDIFFIIAGGVPQSLAPAAPGNFRVMP